MSINERIMSLLKERGLNQADLQRAIGVSKGGLVAWKQDKQKPSADFIMKIAAFFGVTTDYLFGITDLPKPETYSQDELDLVAFYRKLSPNSKQIVMTLAQMEFNHIEAFAQGETPIKVISKAQKAKLDKAKAAAIPKTAKHKKTSMPLLKVYNQAAAAGYGNYLNDNGDNDYEMLRVPSIPYGAEFGIRISGDSMEPEICDGDIVFVERRPSVDLGDIGIFIYDGESYCKQLIYKNNHYYLHSLNAKYPDIRLSNDSIYTVGKVILS